MVAPDSKDADDGVDDVEPIEPIVPAVEAGLLVPERVTERAQLLRERRSLEMEVKRLRRSLEATETKSRRLEQKEVALRKKAAVLAEKVTRERDRFEAAVVDAILEVITTDPTTTRQVSCASATLDAVYSVLVEYLYLSDIFRLGATCRSARRRHLDFYVSGSTINFSQFFCGTCRCFTDAFVMSVVSGKSSVTAIDLPLCTKLTDEAIIEIAANCPALTRLNFQECENLTDDAIIAIAACCPLLTSLNAFDCTNITDVAILAVAMS